MNRCVDFTRNNQLVTYTSVMAQHVSLQPYLLYQVNQPSSWSNHARRSVSVQPRMGQRVLNSRNRSCSGSNEEREIFKLSKATKDCSQEFHFLKSTESLNWSSLNDVSLEKDEEKKIMRDMIKREIYGSRESGIYSENSNEENTSQGCGRSRFDRHENNRQSKRKINNRTKSQPVSFSKPNNYG